MRLLYLILVLFLFLFLQVVVASRISLGAIVPDFPLLLVAFFALRRGTISGPVFGFVVGFIQDLFNPDFLGLNAMTKAILGYLSGRIGKQTFSDNVVFIFGFFFSVSLGHDFVYLLFFLWPDMGGFIATLFSEALPSAAYTAAFGVLLHRVVDLIENRMVRTIGKEG